MLFVYTLMHIFLSSPLSVDFKYFFKELLFTNLFLSRVLEQTCVNQVKRLDTEVSSELVSCMLRAMTENAAYEPAVQMGASAVLVAVGHEYLDLVCA